MYITITIKYILRVDLFELIQIHNIFIQVASCKHLDIGIIY